MQQQTVTKNKETKKEEKLARQINWSRVKIASVLHRKKYKRFPVYGDGMTANSKKKITRKKKKKDKIRQHTHDTECVSLISIISTHASERVGRELYHDTIKEK